MENKFTQKAKKILLCAAEQAQSIGNTYIGSEHLLLGILETDDCIAARALSKRGISYTKIKNLLIRDVEKRKKTVLSSSDISPRLRRIIENASLLSEKYKQELVGSEHLLFSLLGEDNCKASQVIEECGVYIHEIQNDLLEIIQSSQPLYKNQSKSKDDRSFKIESFSRDLNALALDGRMDPTLCRDKETDRVIGILSRRTKNNPCLIGEPGVGKTAVVEGLAQRITEGRVPPTLKSKKILALDIPSLIAGAKYRGEFEDRMKGVMRECIKNPDIILFIDEIHTIVGAGSAEGAIDAANILKPALSRGEIQIIGATTLSEYRKHIEKDSALERRFQPIIVNEPSEEETERILIGLRSRYEKHHGVIISDEAILSAIELSKRYINDRFLPDKAIDLIDEAASRIRLKSSLSSDMHENTASHLSEILDKKEEAVLAGDFSLAKELGKKELALMKSMSDKAPSSSRQAIVGYEDIAEVVTDWTGIPINRLLQSESDRLLSLEEELKHHIIGQNEAVRLVSEAIKRGRIGLKLESQPTGSFLFVGPTGVGKTELCLTLSEILFDSRNALIRLDMSEFMEKHSVSKLIGAPPGYVGFSDGGILTEKVRRKPYSIVLFDEIEKAHPDIFNIMLQILEDGALTDSQGRYVSFKNTIIIMTSNVGSEYYKKSVSLGFSQSSDNKSFIKEQKRSIKNALEKTFSPEFLGRVDEIVYFSPLSRDDIEQICDVMLSSLAKRLKKLNIDVVFTKNIKKLIVDSAYDEESGARRLRRSIRRMIENPISDKILLNEISTNDKIIIDCDGLNLKINNEKLPI